MKTLAIRRKPRKVNKRIRNKLAKFMLYSVTEKNERDVARTWLDLRLPSEPDIFNEGNNGRRKLSEFVEKTFKNKGNDEIRDLRQYRSIYAIMVASKIITIVCSAITVPLIIMDVVYTPHISTFITGIFGAYAYHTLKEYKKRLNSPNLKKVKEKLEVITDVIIGKYGNRLEIR